MRLLFCVFLIYFFAECSRGEKCITKPKLTAFEPKGIRVTLPEIPDLEEFYFWGNINDAIDNRNNADIRVSTFESTDGKWIAEDQISQVKKGDKINYYLYYKRGGDLVKCEPSVLTVTDIETSTNPVTIEKTKVIVVEEPAPVESCPQIHIKSKDVVIDFSGHSDIATANLDKLTYIKIDECNVDYKVASTVDSNILEIKIL